MSERERNVGSPVGAHLNGAEPNVLFKNSSFEQTVGGQIRAGGFTAGNAIGEI